MHEVIRRLIAVDLVDDGAYAHGVLQHCLSRHMGPRGTTTELRRRGVAAALISQVVRAAERDGHFDDAAVGLARDVAARTARLDPEVRRRRFWAAGVRRGHDPEALRRAAAAVFAS